MAASDFKTLVNKVISDDAFAASLVGHPEQTLRSAGIEPTAEMLEALKGVDVASIKTLASSFGSGQAAAAS